MKMEKETILEKLQSFLEDKREILTCCDYMNTSFQRMLETCWKDCLNIQTSEISNLIPKIDSILDYIHDDINTGHWSEVPIKIRRAFSATSYIKCLTVLKQSPITTNSLQDSLKYLDMGLLLGVPLENNEDLLTKSATFLNEQIHQRKTPGKLTQLKRKTIPTRFNYDNLKAIEVKTVHRISLESFNNDYFVPQVPVKLKENMSHWPALTKWLDLNYLLKMAGDRTVPVEIGSHYVDEDWCQKLMPLKQFLEDYFLENTNTIGYLAQHNLFDQIPELKNDIYIPDYCCLGEEEPDINAWLGPEGTVSPLHYDPKNNILTQIFGTKQLILFAPDDTPYLYPHNSSLLFNTSQLDPLKPNIEKYPNFSKTQMYKCLINPGEMIYIPKKWWHHVTALEKSFSVSFWWN